MSTFDGLIREFPTVAIDNFKIRPGVSIYLLSHVHGDHLTGLAAKTWDAPIYCSQITAKWLPMLASKSKQAAFESGQDRALQRKYTHLKPFLRPLTTDAAHYLDLGTGRRARLSLIPAHHCPGAVMFLLQDDRSCILYTGDARNEAVDLQGLKAMPIFLSSAQPIDRLYLDTTCCHQALKEFPSREFVVSDLIDFINRRPRLAHYYIDAWTFGYEDIWIGLSRAFHTRIHVSPYLYELYEAIDDMIHPKILPHLTLDGTSARFHSCRLGPTCGYGGAGGEHSSARELIRIQPNVSWFSAMLQKEREERQWEGDNILAQGKVVGRDYSFKIKERLPPSIGKKDDMCYYINYACHASLSELQQLVKLVSPRAIFPCVLHRDITFGTFFRSNREVIALLAQSMSTKSFSLDVEEYKDRRWPCLADGISTDFQSFYHAKGGYNVLDMNNEIQGIHPANSRHGDLNAGIMVVLDDDDENGGGSGYKAKGKTATHIAILSPRSNHLRKKMDRLRRQLRNTASLEEELDEGLIEDSTLDEGPLSLDLEAIERKRKWWLESERGMSTTQEEHATGEDTDLQYSGIQSTVGQQSSGLWSRILNGLESVTDDVNVHEGDGEEDREEAPAAETCYDQSTLELDLKTTELEEEGEEHRDAQSTQSLTSEGYLSSSPDPIPSLTSFPEDIFRDTPCPESPEAGSIPNLPPLPVPVPAPVSLPFSNSVVAQMDAETEASLTTEHISAFSVYSIPSSSLDVIPQGLLYSMPSLPRTPPLRPSGRDCKIDLGESPSKPRRGSVIAPPPLLSGLVSYTPPTISSRRRVQEPITNIFAQLAWSPPLRPTRTTQPNISTTPISTAQLARTQPDPRHDPQCAPKRGFSTLRGPKRARTTVMDNGKEIILIESSDEDRANKAFPI